MKITAALTWLHHCFWLSMCLSSLEFCAVIRWLQKWLIIGSGVVRVHLVLDWQRMVSLWLAGFKNDWQLPLSFKVVSPPSKSLRSEERNLELLVAGKNTRNEPNTSENLYFSLISPNLRFLSLWASQKMNEWYLDVLFPCHHQAWRTRCNGVGMLSWWHCYWFILNSKFHYYPTWFVLSGTIIFFEPESGPEQPPGYVRLFNQAE